MDLLRLVEILTQTVPTVNTERMGRRMSFKGRMGIKMRVMGCFNGAATYTDRKSGLDAYLQVTFRRSGCSIKSKKARKEGQKGLFNQFLVGK